MTEDERYKAVAAQITQLLDKAATDQCETGAGMLSLGRTLLAAEMYMRNEEAHARWLAEQEPQDG